MPVTVYYENDADLGALDDKTIAILGYGAQGHAHAQNLRDSGCRVVVGQRKGSANYDLAVEHGFEPVSVEEATQQADIVNLLLPDEVQGTIYEDSIRGALQPHAVLMCSHGFNFHFGFIQPPAGIDTLLVAPKGPGHLVRSEFERGAGSAVFDCCRRKHETRNIRHGVGLRQRARWDTCGRDSDDICGRSRN